MKLLDDIVVGHCIGQWVMTSEDDSGIISADTDVFHQAVTMSLAGLIAIATEKYNRVRCILISHMFTTCHKLLTKHKKSVNAAEVTLFE